ncbi:hypothetical protein EVAR_61785_1 [Eumeta japonica]|uniref:Uncharacterized protein n=1 Tax=Eumeta variegata TaxID=151549 RepID=A0A4C1Z426_EUMVA|nr:hypothetical protein EVAR_61785_1 [Eumeta japonica]
MKPAIRLSCFPDCGKRANKNEMHFENTFNFASRRSQGSKRSQNRNVPWAVIQRPRSSTDDVLQGLI